MNWAGILGEFATPPACAALAAATFRRPLRSSWFLGWWTVNAAWGTLLSLAVRSWEWTLGDGASFVVALALWLWFRRKGRKRASSLIGAKARALRDALAKRMPRWEPRLRPQGARA